MFERMQERQGELVAVQAGAESILEQVVQLLHPVVEPEHETGLLEAANRQASAAGQGDLMTVQMLENAGAQRKVGGIADEELSSLAPHLRIGVPVVLVGVAFERRQAAGDEDFAQAERKGGQIIPGAEPAVTLAEHTPRLVRAEELATDRLGIANDAVGAKVHQIIGLRAGVAAPGQRLRQYHAAAAVAARIEQQHLVIVQSALEPARFVERSRSRKAGPSLEK